MVKKLIKLLDPKRFIEYFISGGAYFWFGYLMFFLADSVLGWSLWWAKLLANLSGWTLNYFLQRYWVFGDRRNKRQKETPLTTRYIIITLVDFVMDYFIVAGLKSFGITPYIGQFISSGFFTGWNYVWYRWWVFPAKYVHHNSKAIKGKKIAKKAKR